MAQTMYRDVVREYRKAWHTVATDHHDLIDEWGGFYPHARFWTEDVAAEHGTTPKRVAAVLALTSPRMPWGRNKIVAARIVQALVQSQPTSEAEVLTVLDTMPRVGITHERRRAVAAYWASGVWTSKGPKTSAFYSNLLGNLDLVTIDTWMAKPFGLRSLTQTQYDTIARAITTVAGEAGEFPATVQAILWGYYRRGSGWQRHDNLWADQLTLETAA